jgi:hypothetical protein
MRGVPRTKLTYRQHSHFVTLSPIRGAFGLNPDPPQSPQSRRGNLMPCNLGRVMPFYSPVSTFRPAHIRASVVPLRQDTSST